MSDLGDKIRSKRLDAQTPSLPELDVQTGRPDAQFFPQAFDREISYPSRVARTRVNLRLNSEVLQDVKVEALTGNPKCDLQDAVDEGLRLWLAQRRSRRLDAQTPSSSCSSSVLDLNSEKKDLKTHTTTTLDAQAPKQPAMPGFAADVAELPHGSRYSLQDNLGYAWRVHRRGEGINSPDAWAVSNHRTGKYDAMIDLERERESRAAEAKANQEEERRRQQEARADDVSLAEFLRDQRRFVLACKGIALAMSSEGLSFHAAVTRLVEWGIEDQPVTEEFVRRVVGHSEFAGYQADFLRELFTKEHVA